MTVFDEIMPLQKCSFLHNNDIQSSNVPGDMSFDKPKDKLKQLVFASFFPHGILHYLLVTRRELPCGFTDGFWPKKIRISPIHVEKHYLTRGEIGMR